jgi:arylsulfatase A-like enzyme
MANERPNIVLFMPDQLRADCVGAFGNTIVQTPNIDALARRGTVFSQAFAQSSLCSPSRASIFTGWYSHVYGHRRLEYLLKPWEPNLLRSFKEAGYSVACAGLRGDTFAPGVGEASCDFYGYIVPPRAVFRDFPYPQGHKLTDAFYYGRRDVEGVPLDLDEAAVQTAEQWLMANPREPWLLFVPLAFPHPPWGVEEPWFSMHDRKRMPKRIIAPLDDKPQYMRNIVERYGTDRLDEDDWAEITATYYGMISRIDSQLGRLMKTVESVGAASNTAWAFFPDHGDYMGDFGLIEKWHSGLHESLLRNPLVISAPGMPAGNRCDALVELVDLLPTLFEIAAIEAQHTHFGRSLVPLLKDGSLPHRDEVFAEGGFLVEEARLLEKGRFFPYHNKIGLQQDFPESVGKAMCVRTKEWTYVYRLYEKAELYDRNRDPGETRNLSGRPQFEPVEREMRDRLLRWQLATADAMPWEPDPRFEPKLLELLREALKAS